MGASTLNFNWWTAFWSIKQIKYLLHLLMGFWTWSKCRTPSWQLFVLCKGKCFPKFSKMPCCKKRLRGISVLLWHRIITVSQNGISEEFARFCEPSPESQLWMSLIYWHWWLRSNGFWMIVQSLACIQGRMTGQPWHLAWFSPVQSPIVLLQMCSWKPMVTGVRGERRST